MYFLFHPSEPNLLSGTAHSVNKRGVKRRDLDIEELREILSPLLPFVRIEHILPMNSEVLSDAVSHESYLNTVFGFFLLQILQYFQLLLFSTSGLAPEVLLLSNTCVTL